MIKEGLHNVCLWPALAYFEALQLGDKLDCASHTMDRYFALASLLELLYPSLVNNLTIIYCIKEIAMLRNLPGGAKPSPHVFDR